MKKSLFVFSLYFVGALTQLAAQNDSDASDDIRDKFAFGFKAGINVANVWDESGEEFQADPKIGFAGGLFFAIPIGTYLGVQPELLVSQKGFQGSGMLLGTSYSFSRTTTYLDVPIYLQVKPMQELTLLVGPNYSYLFDQKDEYTFGSNSVEQETEFENDNIRKNLLGLAVGLDVTLARHLVLSGRLAFDFQNNNGDGSNFTPRYKNQWLQFTAGYRF
jgi:hypothetical protein